MNPVACSGLGLEGREQVGRVLRQPGQVARRPQLADQAGGMPRRATCQLPALQQHHVRAAALGEVVGDAAPDDAAADDDDSGVCRKSDHGTPVRAL